MKLILVLSLLKLSFLVTAQKTPEFFSFFEPHFQVTSFVDTTFDKYNNTWISYLDSNGRTVSQFLYDTTFNLRSYTRMYQPKNNQNNYLNTADWDQNGRLSGFEYRDGSSDFNFSQSQSQFSVPYFLSTKSSEVVYRYNSNGEKIGEQFTKNDTLYISYFYINNQVSESMKLITVNGILHIVDEYVKYHENGEIFIKGYFSTEGIQNRKGNSACSNKGKSWTYYNEKGAMILKEKYENGALVETNLKKFKYNKFIKNMSAEDLEVLCGFDKIEGRNFAW